MASPLDKQAREIGYTDYSAYLRSPRWREIKRRYRESSRPQACVVCGAGQVDLHHLTYRRLGRERLSDLQPRCRDCHKVSHGRAEVQPALAPDMAATLVIAHRCPKCGRPPGRKCINPRGQARKYHTQRSALAA